MSKTMTQGLRLRAPPCWHGPAPWTPGLLGLPLTEVVAGSTDAQHTGFCLKLRAPPIRQARPKCLGSLGQSKASPENGILGAWYPHYADSSMER